MRTTLDIDDDVLQAAKEIARHEGSTAGKVLSDLVRRALTGEPSDAEEGEFDEVLGFRLLPKRGGIVTTELVLSIMEEEGI